MAVRDILVVVETADTVPRLVAAAAAIAGSQPVRLVGLFAAGYPVEASYGDLAGWTQLVDAYVAAQRAAASAAETEFRQALAARRCAGDWIFRDSQSTANAIARAALHDLVVVSQSDPDAEPAGALGLRREDVVLGAGRPVLVVPYAGDFATIGRRVLVAWNASREAVRAVHDAMPVLQRADAVTILEIGSPAGIGDAPAVAAAELAAALKRRGIAAVAESEAAGDIALAGLVLSRAAELAADLVVMGAWGHSRLREFVLGGVSRDMFRQMTLPVLMAH